MPTTTIKKVTVNGTVHDIEDSVARAGMLPQEASAGDAMVYNGTEWSKQSGYGYCGEEINSLTWDGSTTGLESVTVTFDFATLTWYKIYPDFIPSNKLVGGTLNYIEEGQPQSYTIQEGYIGPCDQGVDLGYYIGDELLFISAKETVTFNLDQPLQITKGTWFVQAVGDYNYRAASATFSSPVSSVTQIDSKYIPFISNNYVVNFSWNSPYTADKAYSEILSAYNSGKNIIGKTSASGVDIFYNMFLFMENTFAFTADIRSLEMGSIVYSINLRDKVQKQTFAAFTNADKTKLDGIATAATATSVSTTGTSTDEVQYITINGVEKKLAGGGLPDGTAVSQGLVWDGTQWVKQAGYGYTTEGSGQFDVSWDVDPTGKAVAMTNYVKVSDTLPTVQAGDTATCYMLDGAGGSYGPITANVSVPSSSSDMLMIQWTLDTMTFQNYIVLRDTTLYEENISKGVYYFYHDGSGSSKYWCSRMVCAGSSSVTHQFDANLIPNKGAAFVTEAPTAANTDGIRVAYLTSEPATKYDGWLYLIKE